MRIGPRGARMAPMRRPRSHLGPLASALAAAVAFAYAAGCEPADGEAELPALTRPGRTGGDDRPDLAAIRERGTLRLLVARREAQKYLPRGSEPLGRERDLAVAFARDLGVEVEWVTLDREDALIPALLAGAGDLVVDHVAVTPGRRERVAFSAPVALTRLEIVTRVGDAELDAAPDLVGRRVALRRSSPYRARLEFVRAAHPGIELELAPDTKTAQDVLLGVATGEYDVALADAAVVRTVLGYRDDLEVAFDLDRRVAVAWALRPDADKLRKAVDRFLTRGGRAGLQAGLHADDLPGIRERGVLRVLTRNNATTYYVWKGQLVGFEYELAREFAKRLGVRLEMVVPPSRGDLFAWLREGKGDVIAAGLTASPEREESEGVAFSRRTNRVLETFVTRADDDLRELADLRGRAVVVRRSSSYWHTLEALRETGLDFEIAPAPEELETEEIITRVASDEYDLTLADSHVVDVALTWRDDVRAAMTVGDPVDHGWVVRRDARGLLATIDDFFRKEYRGTFYNVLHRRYFEDPKRIIAHARSRADRGGRISPWDDTVRVYAARYGFDWRLIAAQMHQESRFDPAARSFAGAVGLMQVLPRTAREVGIENPADPESGIHAGVRYLARMRDRLGDEVPASERNWFALAAYNAGLGHVRDARVVAAEHGFSSERWFGHVERAMLLKRRPEVAQRSRFGYCRCGEPVKYVRAIRDRYRAYVQIAGNATPARMAQVLTHDDVPR